LGSSGENIVDSSAVFASKLLRDSGELSHLLFPVVKLLSWITLIVFLIDFLSSVKIFSDLFAPLIEKFFEVVDHLVGWSFRSMDVLSFLFPLCWVLLEVDVL